VSIINAVSDSIISLDSVELFGSNDVILFAGSNTTYICVYNYSNLYSILNISSSQNFNITGGLLYCGVSEGNTSLYFIMLNHSAAQLSLNNVNLKLAGKMNSIFYISGGIVVCEYVLFNKLNETVWVNPLFEVTSTVASSAIHFISSGITNSSFRYSNTSTSVYKSAVFFFTDTSAKGISLNISLSNFYNNNFTLPLSPLAYGSLCSLNSNLLSIIFCIILLLLFSCICKGFCVTDSIFESIFVVVRYGGFVVISFCYH
jgi:hypothetical protein